MYLHTRTNTRRQWSKMDTFREAP